MAIRLKTNNWLQLFLHILLIGILGGGFLLLFFFVYLPNVTNHGESLTVPNLQGMQVDEAKKYLDERGLLLIIKDSVYDKDATPFTVLEQHPNANVQVKKGRKIYLTINPRNAPSVKLPELEGLGFETARNKLQKAGLVFGKIVYEPHLEKNNVLKILYNGQKVAQNTWIPQGSVIDLVIGGDTDEAFDVPDLTGLTQEEAELVIKGLNLELGVIKYDTQSEEPLGTVIRQNPMARDEIVEGKMQRAKIKAGEIIDIWVVGSPDAEPELQNDNLED